MADSQELGAPDTQSRYRLLMEQASDGIAVYDLKGNIIEANPRACEMLGYTYEELLSCNLAQIVDADDLAHTPLRFDLLRKGDVIISERLLRCKDGSVLHTEISSRMPADGTDVQVVVRDVTERKRAGESLRYQNDELALLHEITLDLINRLDLTGLLEDILAGAAMLIGTEHGYMYLVESDEEMVTRVGTGVFSNVIGYRLAKGQGLGGRVWQTGRAMLVDDYHAWSDKAAGFDYMRAVVGIPLNSGGKVLGVIGLAFLEDSRKFTAEEINLLSRFGQLASLALENACLYAAAQIELEERKRAETALKASEERFRAVFENALDAMFILDDVGSFVDVNPAACVLSGRSRQDLLKMNVLSLVPYGRMDEVKKLGETFRQEGRMQGEFQIVRGDGQIVDIEYSSSANFLPGYHLFVFSDVTEQKNLSKQLSHQAFHDALTGLPNRALFMDRLQQAITRGTRSHAGAAAAVIFLDLDDFKVINDSLGHKAGDQLLVETGNRLRNCVRPGDSVARLGGDEFTVLLEDVQLNEASLAAERVAEQLIAPFCLEGCEVFVTASVGIAVSESCSDRPDDLLRNADLAMYEAKNKGKARYEIYDTGMNTRAWQRLQIAVDLRRALERNELTVYYQLVVDLTTGLVSEVEALVRWMHPQRGLVSPAEFIPIAEETGLILPIGQWVLEQACRQVKRWQELYPTHQPLTASVNLSLKQFRQPNLVREITRALEESGLGPGQLKLEITESAAMEDAEATIATLQALKALGIQIAIDDFGTGYSALSYLKRFPVDTLKLDGSFVKGLGRDAENTAIVRAILAFAQALNLTVTAEGIETSDQLAHLRALHCDCGQGYYFAQPVTAQAMDAVLSCPGKLLKTGPLPMDRIAV